MPSIMAVPVVVRVSRQDADVDQARRTVVVARWLESVDYPAVRALDIDQPILVNGHAVTFWQSVSDDGQQYATVSEVADVLAWLHRLEAPADLHLPPLEPFEDAAKRISANHVAGTLNSINIETSGTSSGIRRTGGLVGVSEDPARAFSATVSRRRLDAVPVSWKGDG